VFPTLMRPGRLLALLLLVVAVAGGLWLWQRAGSSTPVSEESALREFREGRAPATGGGDGVPRPGVYAFRVEGWEKGGLGPLAVRRDLPGTARYVVRLVPGGFEDLLQLSKEHAEGVRYRSTREGLRATWRRTDVTFVGFGRDDRRGLRPPPLSVPSPLRVGLRWSAEYRADQLRVSTRSRVLRAESVRVGDRTLRAYVIRHDSVTTGPHPGTRVEVVWWAPAIALPVRWTIDGDTTGTVTFRVRASLELTSPEPRR
jgi:hypothetical protein